MNKYCIVDKIYQTKEEEKRTVVFLCYSSVHLSSVHDTWFQGFEFSSGTKSGL